MGLLIRERWLVWEPALAALGTLRGADNHFAYFREMGKELSPDGKRHATHRKQANRDSSKRMFKAKERERNQKAEVL